MIPVKGAAFDPPPGSLTPWQRDRCASRVPRRSAAIPGRDARRGGRGEAPHPPDARAALPTFAAFETRRDSRSIESATRLRRLAARGTIARVQKRRESSITTASMAMTLTRSSQRAFPRRPARMRPRAPLLASARKEVTRNPTHVLPPRRSHATDVEPSARVDAPSRPCAAAREGGTERREEERGSGNRRDDDLPEARVDVMRDEQEAALLR